MNALAQKLLTSSKNLYDDSTDNSFGVYAQAKTFQMGKVFTDFVRAMATAVKLFCLMFVVLCILEVIHASLVYIKFVFSCLLV